MSLTIDQMLDAVAERQTRCPLCGGTENIYISDAQWYYRRAHMPITGGVVAWGDSDCCDPPSDLLADLNIPLLLSCEAEGVDHRTLGSRWGCHWWTVAATEVKWDYDDPRPKPDPEELPI